MAKGRIALGALFGIATGFVAGILTAPKTGKETREDLKKAAQKTKETVVEEAEKAKAVAAEKSQEVREKAEDVIGEVSDRAVEFKGRAEQAIEGAKQGFSKKPSDK